MIAQRTRACFGLAAVFVRELAASALTVAGAVLRREVRTAPAILAVPITLRTDAGIAALANLVSLTPGTTSLHVSESRRTLYVHVLDASDAASTIATIKDTFERRIREIEG